MSQVDYAAMTDEQLKEYILGYREDKAALRTYVERREKQDFSVIANVRNSDFNKNLQAAISQKIGDSTAI